MLNLIDITLNGIDFPVGCTDGGAYCDTIQSVLEKAYPSTEVQVSWSNSTGELRVHPYTDEDWDAVQAIVRVHARGIEQSNWEGAY
jgi:hypothetical protein